MGWDPDPSVPRSTGCRSSCTPRATGSGVEMATRFRRVADILNLSGSTHLNVEQATVVEYSDPAAATHSGRR